MDQCIIQGENEMKMKNSVLHCAFKKTCDAFTDNHTSGNEEAATC